MATDRDEGGLGQRWRLGWVASEEGCECDRTRFRVGRERRKGRNNRRDLLDVPRLDEQGVMGEKSTGIKERLCRVVFFVGLLETCNLRLSIVMLMRRAPATCVRAHVIRSMRHMCAPVQTT